MTQMQWSAAQRYDFFQAIHLLEVAAGQTLEDGIRFRTRPGVAFDASDVLAITPLADGRLQLSSNLISLAGANGPLPMAYTELLLQRHAQRDFAASEFVDIFNQRFMQLLFKARRRVHASLGSPQREQTLAQALRALTQLPLAARGTGLALGPKACALFAMRQRSLAGLQALLAARLGLRVKALPFRGRWQGLGQDTFATVGTTVLSSSASLGRRFWNPAAGIRLQLAPLQAAFSQDQLDQLFPGGRVQEVLRQCVGTYAGPDLTVSIELAGRQCPAPQGLGSSRLGWSSWLGYSMRASPRFFMRRLSAVNPATQEKPNGYRDS